MRFFWVRSDYKVSGVATFHLSPGRTQEEAAAIQNDYMAHQFFVTQRSDSSGEVFVLLDRDFMFQLHLNGSWQNLVTCWLRGIDSVTWLNGTVDVQPMLSFDSPRKTWSHGH
jgi:hypothetical protein